MGFMDKAKAAAQDATEKGKRLAEQAQAKIEETQKSFNEGQAGSQSAEATKAPATEYDKHGRPIAGESIADAVDSPEPIAQPAPQDTGPPQGDPLLDDEPPKSPPSGPSGDSGLTSGDPLA